MPSQPTLDFEGIERQSLRTFTEKAYLDYSMYVILDRALPHIGDGLKPVQRRIVYVMSEQGSTQAAVYNLSRLTLNGTARLDIVGPVLLTLGNALTLNGQAGSSANPLWLTLKIATGDGGVDQFICERFLMLSNIK